MPKAYFEPQNLQALVEVFEDAHRLLKARGQDSAEIRDRVARRIFELAAQGCSPWQILREVIPMSPADVGLRILPGREIRIGGSGGAGHA
jgi:hypothetical protein